MNTIYRNFRIILLFFLPASMSYGSCVQSSFVLPMTQLYLNNRAYGVAVMIGGVYAFPFLRILFHEMGHALMYDILRDNSSLPSQVYLGISSNCQSILSNRKVNIVGSWWSCLNPVKFFEGFTNRENMSPKKSALIKLAGPIVGWSFSTALGQFIQRSRILDKPGCSFAQSFLELYSFFWTIVDCAQLSDGLLGADGSGIRQNMGISRKLYAGLLGLVHYSMMLSIPRESCLFNVNCRKLMLKGCTMINIISSLSGYMRDSY
jgi:hypothetical protein